MKDTQQNSALRLMAQAGRVTAALEYAGRLPLTDPARDELVVGLGSLMACTARLIEILDLPVDDVDRFALARYREMLGEANDEPPPAEPEAPSAEDALWQLFEKEGTTTLEIDDSEYWSIDVKDRIVWRIGIPPRSCRTQGPYGMDAILEWLDTMSDNRARLIALTKRSSVAMGSE